MSTQATGPYQVTKLFRNGYGIVDTRKPVGERWLGISFKRKYQAEKAARERNAQVQS